MYTYTILATALISLLLFVFSWRVGQARGRHKIDAPAMTGHEELERAIRVHGNSVEQAVMFLPLMWTTAWLMGDVHGGAIGLVFIIGRLIYARAYMAGASRMAGMMTGMVAIGYGFAVTVWKAIEALI